MRDRAAGEAPRGASARTEARRTGMGSDATERGRDQHWELHAAPPAVEPDYYAVLGVAPGASDAQISHAYRRLAKLWHPDRYSAAPAPLRARAERRMRALNGAHTILGDPARRALYDMRQALAPHAGAHVTHSWSGANPQEASWHTRATFATSLGHASGNPNGAGEFLGILCLILGLGLLASIVSGQAGDGPAPYALLLACGVLLALGGAFFVGASPLARMAHAWAEGDPAGERPSPRYAATPPLSAARPARDDPTEQQLHSGVAFERLVDEALASIPDVFLRQMPNLLVEVEGSPDEETLRGAGVAPGHLLLGLYQGVPLTRQGVAGAVPEIITIYRVPIEQVCADDPTRIRAQVRKTVLHEIAHHFGMDHDTMPGWVK